jgi:hypothetical protein
MKRNAILLMTIILFGIVSEKSIAAIQPPTLSYATNGVNLTASWTSVPEATGYELYYAPYPYTGENTVGSIDVGDDTTFNYTLWDGAAYYIAVKAYNSQETSGYSNIESFTIPYSGPPDAPQLFYELDGTSIYISWGQVPGATGYILSYTTSVYTGPKSFMANDLGDNTSFSYSSLSEGGTYTIALQAYNEFGPSDYSNIETFTASDSGNGGGAVLDGQGNQSGTDIYYSFDVTPGQNLTVALTGLTDNADLFASTPSTCNQGHTMRPGTNPEDCQLTTTGSKLVVAVNGLASSHYTLSVAPTPLIHSPVNESSVQIPPNVPTVGQVETRGTSSYSTTGLTQGTHTVSITGLDNDADLHVYSDDGYPFEIDCTLRASGDVVNYPEDCTVHDTTAIYFSVRSGELNRDGASFNILVH